MSTERIQQLTLANRTLQEQLSEANAENARLKTDAKRYRWLRGAAQTWGIEVIWTYEPGGPIEKLRLEQLDDATIDAAIAREA